MKNEALASAIIRGGCGNRDENGRFYSQGLDGIFTLGQDGTRRCCVVGAALLGIGRPFGYGYAGEKPRPFDLVKQEFELDDDELNVLVTMNRTCSFEELAQMAENGDIECRAAKIARRRREREEAERAAREAGEPTA